MGLKHENLLSKRQSVGICSAFSEGTVKGWIQVMEELF